MKFISLEDILLRLERAEAAYLTALVIAAHERNKLREAEEAACRLLNSEKVNGEHINLAGWWNSGGIW